MPPFEYGFDCSGFAAYIRHADGTFHPVDLSQTVTLSPDLTDEEDETNCGRFWDASDPYHYKLVGDWELKAVMQCRYGARFMMKITSTPRAFRRWLRAQEKERRRRLKEGK